MIETECMNCGEQFLASSNRAKYCSTSCKQQAYRSRQEDEDPDDGYERRADGEDWDEGPDGVEPGHRYGQVGDNDFHRNDSGKYDAKNRLRYDQNEHRYGKDGERYGSGVTERYDKNGDRYGKNEDRYGSGIAERYGNAGEDHGEESRRDEQDEDNSRRRYPPEFYTETGMFTAHALARLHRLDLIALKHKDRSFTDEDWFEFTHSINGIPLDIYAEAREELEREETDAAIAEMNARIARWFPRLVELTQMDEVKVKWIEKLVDRIANYARSERFRKVPPDHPHRLELLDELDFFSQLAEDCREEGRKAAVLNPSAAFLDRMDKIIREVRKG